MFSKTIPPAGVLYSLQLCCGNAPATGKIGPQPDRQSVNLAVYL